MDELYHLQSEVGVQTLWESVKSSGREVQDFPCLVSVYYYQDLTSNPGF